MGQRIDQLLRRHEDKTLEFKRDLSSPDRVIATLVAFANSAGGVVVLGVEDGTRAVTGIADPTVVEEGLANLVADRIVPSLMVEISVVPWRSTYLVIAEVFPSARRPHCVRKLGQGAGTYVRIGSSNRLADEPLRAEFARGTAPTFDETPLFDAAADRTRPAIRGRRTWSGQAPLTQAELLSLHALERSGGQCSPNGWRLSVVQEGHRAGPDARRVGSVRSILWHGPHQNRRTHDESTAVWSSSSTGRSNISIGFSTAPRVVSGRSTAHEIVRPVPMVALREAVVNAVVHADYRQQGGPIRIAVYSDRIEIENPGLLLPGLTVEDLFDGVSRLRNRMIGRVFAERGYIEQWGSGVRRMTDLCVEAGLPRPVIEERPAACSVTFQMDRTTSVVLKPREQQALAAIDATHGISVNELASQLAVTSRTARSTLAAMLIRGLVIVVGSSLNDPHRRFYRADTDVQTRRH